MKPLLDHFPKNKNVYTLFTLEMTQQIGSFRSK